MNGSTEKRKPPIVLHGVGQQRERQRTDAERVEESPRCGRGRTLANETRGKRTRESVLCVSRELDRFESCTWEWQLACHPQPRPK